MRLFPAMLELRLGQLASEGHVSLAECDALGAMLRAMDDWDLLHINPFHVAPRLGVDGERACELLFHARRARIVELRFHSVCTACGAMEHRYERLEDVPREHFRCTQCEYDIPTGGGTRVEAAFRVTSEVGAPRIDPFSSMTAYRRFFLSPWIVPSSEFAAYLARALVAHAILERDATETFDVDIRRKHGVRLVSYDRHTTCTLRPDATPGLPDLVEVESRGSVMSPAASLTVNGRARIRVRNVGAERTGVFVFDGDLDAYHDATAVRRAERRAFLTARDVLERASA